MKRLMIALAAAALVTGCAQHRDTGRATTDTGTTTGTGVSSEDQAQPTQGDAAGKLWSTNSATGTTTTNGTVNPNSNTNSTVNPEGSSTPSSGGSGSSVTPSGFGSGNGANGYYRL